MLAEERFSLIMEQLNRKRTVTVQELCEALNTSESTIRRDLTELDRLGKLNKVHGGAEGPCQSVQHAGLALIVVAAHDGEASGRRRECNGLDAFDVFGFQSRDLYRHADTSP